jgi:hypothetical protein
MGEPPLALAAAFDVHDGLQFFVVLATNAEGIGNEHWITPAIE